MKFVHLSDLHIGKRVGERSLIEEQKHILEQICGIIEKQKPDAVLIAGDVYDKNVPSAEAVMLFDDFLYKLSSLPGDVFIISGNHDSAERNAFGSRLMKKQGIHLSPVYDGKIEPVTLHDEWGETDIYMIPFLKPALVRHYLPEEEKERVNSYDSALREVVGQLDLNRSRRNVVLSHQFVTGSRRCDSEDINVGGLDNVDSSVFADFDYVALGHLHKPQDCHSERIRYCGSPLKYSFSEVDDKKSLTIVTLQEKGAIMREFIELAPLYDWHEVKGEYDRITARDFYYGTSLQEDFVRIVLTDENDIPDAVGKLRSIYHNLLELRYDNRRTRAGNVIVTGGMGTAEKQPLELFSELYEMQNAAGMTKVQKDYIEKMISMIWEDKA